MTSHEESLQKQIEEGKTLPSHPDTRAYQKVFDGLRQEPDFELPLYFEDRILQQIEAQEKRAERRGAYWLIAGVFLLVIAAVIGAALVGFKPSFGAFAFLSRYTGLFIFGIVFIMALQWIDRKIVQRPGF
jgi:hypothetical protein